MSSEPYKPKSSISPYASMVLVAFGIILLIFGGMIDSATRSSRQFPAVGPVLSAVTIPVGIGMIVFGSLISKHAKKQQEAEQRNLRQQSSQQPSLSASSSAPAKRCGRCNIVSRSGATFCANCGQRLS